MENMENVGERSSPRIEHNSLKTKYESIWPRLEPWLPALITLLFLGVWELLSRAGWISRLFFPAPTTILATLIELIINGKLAPNLGATIGRLSLGFLLGGSAGLVLGLTMGWWPRLRAVADPIIAALHPIPKIAIFPLIMIVFGIGEASKVVAIAIASFFPLLISSMAGVRQINPIYFEVTKNYGAGRWKTFSRVVVPGSLPMILSGVRLALNVALVITIAVELVSANQGLGVMIWFAWQTLRIEDLYAALVVTSALGVSINMGLLLLSKRLAPWHDPKSNQEYS